METISFPFLDFVFILKYLRKNIYLAFYSLEKLNVVLLNILLKR